MVKPRGWCTTELGDLVPQKLLTIQTGPFGTMLQASEYARHGAPIVSVREIKNESIQIFDETPRVHRDTIKRIPQFLLKQNDLVFARKGSVDRCALVTKRENGYFLGSDAIRLRFSSNFLSPLFIIHYFHSHAIRNYLNQSSYGTTMAGLNERILSSMPLCYPKDRQEQTAIAEALSDADSLIASLQKLIAKKKAIKQGAMQELLTGKKRLPGVNGEWIDGTFGALFNINGGVSASREQLSQEGYCYLHYGDIHGSFKQYIDVIAEFTQLPRLNIPLTEISKASLLKDGDIVFVDASEDDDGASKHIVIRNEKNIPYISGLHTIICNSKGKELNNLFKEYCFCHSAIRKQFKFFAAGTKVTGLSKSNLAKIILRFPADLREQTAIAQVLSDMDAEIEQLEKKLSKYQQIKQGMMQELLTGRIRLVDAMPEQVQPTAKIISFTTASEQKQPAPAQKHNQHFDDAVMIAGIVDAFYSDKYPLGRKKVQKLLYLMRRWEESDVSAFQKKAAGPYADSIRYKGGEPIATKSKYIVVEKNERGTRFSRGENIAQALSYIQTWEKQESIGWLVINFQRTKVDDLELFATIDMAACDLRDMNQPVSVQTIKELISSTKEWRAKLAKTFFSDQDIQRAINNCREFFGEH